MTPIHISPVVWIAAIIVVLVAAACLAFLMVANTKRLKHHEGAIWSDICRWGPIPVPWHLYEISEERIFEQYGLVRVTSREAYNYLATDVRLEETLIQRLCGTGTVVIRTRDEDSRSMRLVGVKNPEETRERISAIIRKARHGRREVLMR